MTIESARAAIEDAVTKALGGDTAEVSPSEHGVSASELSQIADEEMARRDGASKLDISFFTESHEADGTLVFRPSTG